MNNLIQPWQQPIKVGSQSKIKKAGVRLSSFQPLSYFQQDPLKATLRDFFYVINSQGEVIPEINISY